MRIGVPIQTAVLEALHVVPAADATVNAVIRDVLGNKEDTADTVDGNDSSVMRYIKGLMSMHNIPAKDASANVRVRDVVGDKEDTYDAAFDSTTKSLVAKVKGVLFHLRAAAADTVSNSYMREVVGSKIDTEQATVTAEASLMRYMKALIQELAQRGTSEMASAMTTSNTVEDVVNITDKGVLTGISQHSEGADPGRIVVTIDGVEIFALGQFTYDSQANSLAFNHRFNTSLQVEHANVGGSVEINTIVAYTID